MLNKENLKLEQYEIKKPDFDTLKRSNKYNDIRFESERFSKKDDWWVSRNKRKNEVNLLFTGDLACFQAQYREAMNEEGWDFNYCFDQVRDIFSKADLVAGNFETCLYQDAPYRGEKLMVEDAFYCNAPLEYLEAVRNAKFDVLTTANNHDLDAGAVGIGETIDYISRYGIIQTGTFKEEKKRYELIDVSGFKIAITAFTIFHNGMDENLTSKGQKFLLNDYNDEIAKQILVDAKAKGAEKVFACVHWGTEHKLEQNDQQVQMAHDLAAMGYDCIIGSHPHVLQPYREIKIGNKIVPVFYSLGNFLAAGANVNSRSAIASIKLKRKKNDIELECSFIPTFTSKRYGEKKYVVLPIAKNSKNKKNKEYLDIIRGILGDKIAQYEAQYKDYEEDKPLEISDSQKLDYNKIQYFPYEYLRQSVIYTIFEKYACVSGSFSKENQWKLVIKNKVRNVPVVDVKKGAFAGNETVRRIEIGGKLNRIREEIAKDCINLEGVQVGKSIQVIENSAFENCSNLAHFTFGTNIKKIEKKAFKNCINLKSLKFKGKNIQIADDAFENCDKVIFYCPKDSDAEKYAIKNGLKVINMFDNMKVKSKKKSNVFYDEAEKPFGTKIASISKDGIEFYWKKVEKASGYEVFRSYKETGDYESIGINPKRTMGEWMDNSFDYDKRKVYYKVRSYVDDKDGNRIYSDLTEPTEANYRSEMILERESTFMYSGAARKIRAFYGWGEVKDAKWSTNDESVATISEDGVIKAISQGVCKIICTSDSIGEKATAKVVVDRKAPEPLSEIKARFELEQNGYFVNPSAEKTNEAIIMMVGDMMCGKRQMVAQWKDEEGWNFNDSYYYVKELTKKSDFAVGNLETLLAAGWPYMGDETYINNKNNCNAPSRYLDAVRYGGFDAVVMANNHNCDGGTKALLETIDQVDKYQFAHTGVFRDNSQKKYFIADVNGIKVGFLSYISPETGFNGKDEDWTEKEKDILLNIFDPEKAKKDIGACKKAGAEYVIVYMHWGFKNFRKAAKHQIKQAQEVAEAGADYIVGSNPHVLQKYEVLNSADGRKVPCFYSIGNYQAVMNQIKGNRDSVVVRIRLKKDNNGNVKLIENNYIPCHTYTNLGNNHWTPVVMNDSFNVNVTKKYKDTVLSRISDALGDEIVDF